MCGGLTIHKPCLFLPFCAREHGFGEQRQIQRATSYAPTALAMPALPYLFVNKLNHAGLSAQESILTTSGFKALGSRHSHLV